MTRLSLWKPMAIVALFVALAFVLVFISSGPSSAGSTPPSESEFPNLVNFEQGATRFLKGDNITITEVRGTSDSFSRGQLYWIKGTYTLTSHDQVTLAAYTTAMDSKEAISTPLKVQLTPVDRGHGTFTLFLPMVCRGWPHVSFYDEKDGFGGNYFGTGDSVLKHWWDEQAKDKN